jgi:hypothetical protein
MIKYRKSSKFGEKLEHKTVVLYNDLSAAHRRKKWKFIIFLIFVGITTLYPRKNYQKNSLK